MNDGKRAFERALIRSSTLVVGGGKPVAGHTRDLSPGGAFIETSAEVPVGAEVQLFIDGGALALRDSAPGSLRAPTALRAPATVVRVEPGIGFGVRFDAQPETQAEIGTFLRRVLPVVERTL